MYECSGAEEPCAQLCLLDRAADGERQALQAILEHVVRGPGFHQLDRELLADGAGDENDRQLRRQRAHERQGGVSAKARHVVIREHDLRPHFGERRAKGCLGLDALRGKLDIPAPERALDQLGVRGRVFEDQDAEGIGHGALRAVSGWSVRADPSGLKFGSCGARTPARSGEPPMRTSRNPF